MEITRKTILNDEEYLRQISKPVNLNNDNWKEAVALLKDYCQNRDLALAMAAVQLGIPLRLIYLKKTDLNRLDEDYDEAIVMINPVIKRSVGLTKYWEACASCLNYMGLVNRPYLIEVEYYDDKRKKHTQTYEGFAATVISHELDHLDGILHIDIAEEVLEMEAEERKIFRKDHPYKIISKTCDYDTQFKRKVKK